MKDHRLNDEDLECVSGGASAQEMSPEEMKAILNIVNCPSCKANMKMPSAKESSKCPKCGIVYTLDSYMKRNTSSNRPLDVEEMVQQIMNQRIQ